ncbi:serine hydrolase domain-containing protein [Gordonia paraffinivorans]|uniref:serine hydrolase domain-containing protein n=1 Tax=Gordonia paraffinivorans TaxID=175628 RepID=UPI0014489A07|nr:serine hydrolase domain-containing protein [Gordonia paraffinivorans]
MTVQGTWDERFEGVARILQNSINAGEDVGASVAVTLDGKKVVDLWGGWTDEERTKPWQEDTICNVWSNTKTVTALAALVLIDRGDLDPYAPVAKYWPEFAANGKEDIQVRHVLSHTSGVAGWDLPVTMDDIYDPEISSAKLAAQAPWWEPGTSGAYHALSIGHLVNELVTRVTGQTLGKFVAQEIAGPLGADFHIGLDPAEDDRLSPLLLPPEQPAFDAELIELDEDSVGYKLTVAGLATDPRIAWEERWQRSEICGAGNGIGNARSLATIQSIVSHGGEYDGVRLLSEKTCNLIFQEHYKGLDGYLGLPIRWGVGYALSYPEAFPYLPDGRVCFWAGWGGSMVINDLDRRMTIAYVMNQMEPGVLGTYRGIVGGVRSEAIIRQTYASLDR